MHLGTTRLARRVSVAAICAAIVASFPPAIAAQEQTAPGGFIDSATGAGLRPRLSAAEIRTFLPARGAFTFPAPYGTRGARLTNGDDCGGADCVQPVGYSYWNNINNHAGSDTMLVFLGLERRKGGGGPTLFSYNKTTGETRNLGPLFSSDSPYSWSTGEGWYFSATHPTTLYLNDGPKMMRYDLESKALETVFDVRNHFGGDKYLWQMHSSHDDRVHSATLRHSSTFEMLGCVVYEEVTGRARLYAKKGDFDECQIDKSGRWLVIKEDVDSAQGEDNRVIDLQTDTERVLLDPRGAAGHSDVGFGYVVGEDNFHPQPGAVRVWRFDMSIAGGEPLADERGQGSLVYQLSSWSSGLGHLAHGNAQPGVPLERQMACSSNAHRQNLPRVNEIVCYRLDESLEALIVAPNMTDLDAGSGSDDYWKYPKGNIDPTGEFFVWTTNAGSSRLDAFIVRIPRQKLTGDAPGGTTPPTPTPTPAPQPPPPPPGGTDTTAPNVALVSPGNGSTVRGATTLLADANDASGIAAVTFRIDGVPVGEVAAPPFTMGWDSRGVANGQHTITAVARDAAGNTADSTATVTVDNAAAGGAPQTDEPVRWTNLVNSSASGNTLQKSGGCGGCPDAGAVSEQRLASTGGVFAFAATERETLRFVGLGGGNGGTAATDILFGLRLHMGTVEVREAGAYKAETTFAQGDRLQITVSQGRVTYSKNGSVFYTSAQAASGFLAAQASLYDLGATVGSATISK